MTFWIKESDGKNINKSAEAERGLSLMNVDDTTLMTESEEELKSLLMRVKEESKNVGLKPTFRKRRSWHLVPSLHGKWGESGNRDRPYFVGLQDHYGWGLQT